MKAKDWKFHKYLPDSEDIEVACKTSEVYFHLPPIKGVNEVDAFHAGFNRGIAWAIAKQSEEIKYAKEESQTGEHMKICHNWLKTEQVEATCPYCGRRVTYHGRFIKGDVIKCAHFKSNHAELNCGKEFKLGDTT